MNDSERIDYFYALSELLTGYDLVTLYGTGQGDRYFQTLNAIVGEWTVGNLLDAFEALQMEAKGDAAALHRLVGSKLIADPQWGPLCKNINQMWYMGNWYQLPAAWRENYVWSEDDVDKVISAESYKEGLVWTAMGQHPKSAKQPGFGTWAFPPAN